MIFLAFSEVLLMNGSTELSTLGITQFGKGRKATRHLHSEYCANEHRL
jgi:hypothetical protein